MARKSNSGGRLDDVRHVLVVTGLLVGVLGTLALGAALRVDPWASSASAIPPSATAPLAPRPAPPSEPRAEEELEAFGQPDSFDDLDASGIPGAEGEPASGETDSRETDSGEPDPSAATFTLQFMVACKPDVVARVRETLAGDAALRISTVEVAGQPCQRIAWGRFEDPEVARDAIQDAPAALLELTRQPLVRRLDEPQP